MWWGWLGAGAGSKQLSSHWRLCGRLMLQRTDRGCLGMSLRQPLVPALLPPACVSMHSGMAGLFLSAAQEQLLKGAVVWSTCPDSQANPCQPACVFSFPKAKVSPRLEEQALSDPGCLRSALSKSTLSASSGSAVGNSQKEYRSVSSISSCFSRTGLVEPLSEAAFGSVQTVLANP